MSADDKKGKRYNKGKVRWRNFPLWLCRPLADIGTYGELKYEESWNFLKGLSVTDCIDSLYRHLEDFDNPALPDEDLESKLNHLGHIAWNALVAYHMMKNHPELDDRYKKLKNKEAPANKDLSKQFNDQQTLARLTALQDSLTPIPMPKHTTEQQDARASASIWQWTVRESDEDPK